MNNKEQSDKQINLTNIINEAFNFIEIVPLPISIYDIESKKIVRFNEMFKNIVKRDKNIFYDSADIIKSSDLSIDEILSSKKAKLDVMIFVKTLDGLLIPLLTKVSTYKSHDRAFLFMTHEQVVDDILPSDLNVKDLPSYNTFESILKNLPVFCCILALNKKEITFTNNVCDRFFGISVKDRLSSEFFYDLEDLEMLDNALVFHVDFYSILGSKWFYFCSFYINFNGEKSILLMGKDVSKRKKLEDKLLMKASIDEFTLTYNRQAGIDFIKDRLEDLQKESKLFTVSNIRINNLNSIQNKYGLLDGDDYIIKIVDVIKGAIRQTDILARMSYEEFILLFPNCVEGVVENIMSTIVNKLELLNGHINDIKYSISYGILEVEKDTNFTVDDVVRNSRNKIKA